MLQALNYLCTVYRVLHSTCGKGHLRERGGPSSTLSSLENDNPKRRDQSRKETVHREVMPAFIVSFRRGEGNLTADKPLRNPNQATTAKPRRLA